MEFIAFLFAYGALAATGAATITWYLVRQPEAEPQYRAPRAELPVARVVRRRSEP